MSWVRNHIVGILGLLFTVTAGVGGMYVRAAVKIAELELKQQATEKLFVEIRAAQAKQETLMFRICLAHPGVRCEVP